MSSFFIDLFDKVEQEEEKNKEEGGREGEREEGKKEGRREERKKEVRSKIEGNNVYRNNFYVVLIFRRMINKFRIIDGGIFIDGQRFQFSFKEMKI